MKTPLDTRGSRANDGRSARLGKKQPDGTHAHRIAHPPYARPGAGYMVPHARPGAGYMVPHARPCIAVKGLYHRPEIHPRAKSARLVIPLDERPASTYSY